MLSNFRKHFSRFYRQGDFKMFELEESILHEADKIIKQRNEAISILEHIKKEGFSFERSDKFLKNLTTKKG